MSGIGNTKQALNSRGNATNYITSVRDSLVSFETCVSCRAVELLFLREGLAIQAIITPGRSTLKQTESLENEATGLGFIGSASPF
jgi:hypothetical protein